MTSPIRSYEGPVILLLYIAAYTTKVLKRAREVDPHGLRTLGVITKPDQLVKGSDDEKLFLSLARNEQVEFSLGWHVVRNLDSSDGEANRDAVETQFMAESNFRSLSATSLGITHLRQRLSVVLFEQIKSELPLLIEDIGVGISGCRDGLNQLGTARETPDDQRKFLVDLSSEFQSLCEAATKGDYEHPFFADRSRSDRRLSAMIANRGVQFEEEIRTAGARWRITECGNRKKNQLTRTEAIEEVRKLLRKSRGREVRTLKLLRSLLNSHSCQDFPIHCSSAKSSANIVNLGKAWPVVISWMSGI
jgi:hypothetical protein